MTSKTKNRPIASKPQLILPKETDNVIYILSDQATSVKAENDNNIVENSDDPIIEIFDGGGGQEGGLEQDGDQQHIYQIIGHPAEDFGENDGEEKEYTETITIVSDDQGMAGEDIVYVTSEESVVRDAEGQVAFVQVRVSSLVVPIK